MPGYRCKLFISRIFFLGDVIGQCQMGKTPLWLSPSDLIARIFILPLSSDTEQCVVPVNAMDPLDWVVTTELSPPPKQKKAFRKTSAFINAVILKEYTCMLTTDVYSYPLERLFWHQALATVEWITFACVTLLYGPWYTKPRPVLIIKTIGTHMSRSCGDNFHYAIHHQLFNLKLIDFSSWIG